MRCVCVNGCHICRDFNQRQQDRYGWAELLFAELQMLPLTLDCPAEERC